MRNVIFWKNNQPTDPIKCMSWFPNIKFGFHWLCKQYQTALDHSGTSAKIIIYEDPIIDISLWLATESETNIILLQQDHLHYTNQQSLVSENIIGLIKLASQYPNKRFLFHCFTGQLSKELNQVILPSNLIVTASEVWCFWWGLTIYKYGHQITKKNPNIKKFICLNNRNRPHRSMLVAYLLGKNLDQHGDVSCLEWNQYINLPANCPQSIVETIQQGIDSYSSDRLLDVPYSNKGFLHNYNHQIFNLHKSSYAEIISETTFFETSRFITDKYIQSVLGANFPILIAVEGTATALKDIGFDLFDDIVDHSYDIILDPVVRLASAVDLNLDLLTDPHIDLLWQKYRQRFLTNQHYMFTELLDRVNDIVQKDCYANVQQLAQLH